MGVLKACWSEYSERDVIVKLVAEDMDSLLVIFVDMKADDRRGITNWAFDLCKAIDIFSMRVRNDFEGSIELNVGLVMRLNL